MRRDTLWRILGGCGIALVLAGALLHAEDVLMPLNCDWLYEHDFWLWLSSGCWML